MEKKKNPLDFMEDVLLLSRCYGLFFSDFRKNRHSLQYFGKQESSVSLVSSKNTFTTFLLSLIMFHIYYSSLLILDFDEVSVCIDILRYKSINIRVWQKWTYLSREAAVETIQQCGLNKVSHFLRVNKKSNRSNVHTLFVRGNF